MSPCAIPTIQKHLKLKSGPLPQFEHPTKRTRSGCELDNNNRKSAVAELLAAVREDLPHLHCHNPEVTATSTLLNEDTPQIATNLIDASPQVDATPLTAAIIVDVAPQTTVNLIASIQQLMTLPCATVNVIPQTTQPATTSTTEVTVQAEAFVHPTKPTLTSRKLQKTTSSQTPKRGYVRKRSAAVQATGRSKSTGSNACEKLGEILEKPHLKWDVRKLSPGYQTSRIEAYHSVLNHFAPKMIGFAYQGMLSRLYLAAMHFNENGCREQAINRNGERRVSVSYPKYKKGQSIIKNLKTDITFRYAEHLIARTCLEAGMEICKRRTQEHIPVPKPLCHTFQRLTKEEAVQRHLTRFSRT